MKKLLAKLFAKLFGYIYLERANCFINKSVREHILYKEEAAARGVLSDDLEEICLIKTCQILLEYEVFSQSEDSIIHFD